MNTSKRENIIKKIADSYVEKELFSGIEWLAEKSGKTILSGKSGYQKFEDKTPIPNNAIYRIYSMTKPVTAVLALKLIEKGMLRLYDPVSAFIPSFENLKVLRLDGTTENISRPMNIEDLLTHRSGLTYDFLLGCHVAPLYSAQDISDDGSKNLEEKCESLSQLPLAYQPGERFNYSVSLDVLARIIEIVSGKDFHKILEEEIFEPLGMKDTGFGVREENTSRLMSTYGASNFKEIMNARPHEIIETNVDDHNPHNKGDSFQRGGTGLFSTTQDYLSFARMLLTGKSQTGEIILSRNMINFMRINRIPKAQLPLMLGPLPLVGYGWNLAGRIVLDRGKLMSLTGENEFGWAGAASTYFWVDPDEDLVGLIMTQYLGSIWPINDDLRVAMYQAVE
jgi:CubicO group peptidase (beta-lactamase class C family)